MAKIWVKKRSEPVIISNTRARLLKETWMDAETPKEKIVDLGDWAGEYGEIKSIEFESEVPVQKTDYDLNWKTEMEKFKNLSPDEKCMHTGRFLLFYASRHDWKKPPEDVLKKAIAIQLQYYKKHPEAVSVPNTEFEKLVGGHPAKTLGEKMQYKPTDEGKKEYKRLTGKEYKK